MIRIIGFYKMVEEKNLHNAILQIKLTRILVMGRGLGKLSVWVEVGKRSLWIIGYVLIVFQVFLSFLLALLFGLKWTFFAVFSNLYVFQELERFYPYQIKIPPSKETDKNGCGAGVGFNS